MLPERFMAKIRVRDGDTCWEWTGAKSLGGYGVTWHDGRQMGAHQRACNRVARQRYLDRMIDPSAVTA